MRQKLTEYVDAIFRSAALTVRNAELKEENHAEHTGEI